MTSNRIASSMVAAATLSLLASGAAAADAKADTRFAGRWIEVNGPQPAHVFETRLAEGKLSLAIPSDMAPPNGRTLWLERAGPDLFKTAPGDAAKVEFRITGPRKAHLEIRSYSVKWTSVTSTDLEQR